jgi:hypothetical protein
MPAPTSSPIILGDSRVKAGQTILSSLLLRLFKIAHFYNYLKKSHKKHGGKPGNMWGQTGRLQNTHHPRSIVPGARACNLASTSFRGQAKFPRGPRGMLSLAGQRSINIRLSEMCSPEHAN